MHSYLDVLEHNATSSLVLELHQFLSVLTLLIRGFLEELVESTESYIIPVKVECLQESKFGS